MIGDYFNLATKNLRHRGIRSWLTLLGIFIGVAAVISLISLSGAIKLAITSQFGVSDMEVITIQAGGLSNVGPPGAGAANPLEEGDVAALDRISGVDFTYGSIISTGKTEYNRKVNFGYLSSIPNGENKDKFYEVDETVVQIGRLLKDSDTNKILVGNNYYTNEDRFGKRLEVGKKVMIQDKEFEVAGILKKKGSFILDNIILMNEDSLRNLLDYGDRVDIITVKLIDKDMMDKVKEDIEKTMRQRRDVEKGKEDFSVSTPEAALQTINQVLGGIQIFIIIIASVSIIVGAIGIANTMTTSVLERKKEIGIMKAIGARNSQIFMQFLIESGLLGLAGGMAGVLFGVFIGYVGTIAINGFIGATISPEINFPLIIGALLGSFLIGSIFGIIPAMNAAKQNPVEALRG